MDIRHCFILMFSLWNMNGEEISIEIIDMTRPTHWKVLWEYYNALEKRWKVCINCGSPSLGTAMHLDHSGSSSMHPAFIPSEFLVTRLLIIDVTTLVEREEEYILTLDVALQWPMMKHDPQEPTLLLFKFGWTDNSSGYRLRSCACKTPGISLDLAEWISLNMTRVVGVATDGPTLESSLTRDEPVKTISNHLGKNGVFMIENVMIKKNIPAQGCMAIAMPMKLISTNYVPTRLSAFCPTAKTEMQVTVALQKSGIEQLTSSRIYDNINLDEILN